MRIRVQLVVFMILWSQSALATDVACDGSNDTSDVQDAIAFGIDNAIVLSAGVCEINLEIALESNLRISGAGIGLTIVEFIGTSGNVLSGTDVHHVTVSGMTILHNGGGAGHGIRFGGDVSDIILNDLEIRNPPGYGIGFQTGGAELVSFRRIAIDRVSIFSPGADGIDFKNPNNLNRDVRISNVLVDNPGNGSTQKAGIDLRGAGFLLTNITIANLSENTHGIRFRQDGTNWGAGGHRSSLSGFFVSGNGGVAVQVANADNTISEGSIEGVAVGVKIVSSTTSVANRNSVIGVRCLGCGLIAFHLSYNEGATPPSYNRFIGCTASDGGENGFEISGSGNLVSGSVAMGQVGVGLEIKSDAVGTIVGGNTLTGNGSNYVDNGAGTIGF